MPKKSPMGRTLPSERRFKTDRQAMLENVNSLVTELHDKRFTNLWIESFNLGGDRQFYQRVIIDREDLGPDQIEHVQAIAAEHGGKIALIDVKLGRLGVTRLAIWPGRVS